MHIIEHLFGALGPDLVIALVAEQADTYNNVALKREPLLLSEKLIFKPCAPAQGDYFVVSYHINLIIGPATVKLFLLLMIGEEIR